MSSTAYTPGIGNGPFGLLPANPQGSNYAAESGYTTEETILIAKAIKEAIYDAAPQMYDAMKLLTMRGFESVNSDEFEYLEKTFGRTALVVDPGFVTVPAQAGAPGVPQTATITLTAASMQHVSPDMVILFPNNAKAVIRSVDTALSQIVVESQTSDGLPAIVANDVISIQSVIEADGMNYFSNYERLDTITRYNYVQFFARARRWAKVELQKYINNGTTDYLNHDKEHKLKQIRLDLFNSFINGQRGEFRISNGYIAKAMGGVFPTMQAAGSLSANPTLAGLQAAFETLAFSTNYKAEGGTRFLLATDEMLHEFSKIYKQPGLQYAPNDEVAKLRLKRIELGSQNWVLVPTELFREESCFPAEWQRRILALDYDTIQPVIMKGIPAVDMGETDDRSKGSRENYKDWWVTAQLSLRFNNPTSSFWMDIA